jgi:SAM-dependent methyltransferase
MRTPDCSDKPKTRREGEQLFTTTVSDIRTTGWPAWHRREESVKYDLDLFLSLNEEYKTKPLVPAPPTYDPATLVERAARRVENINRKVPVAGKRVLEIGCGRGEVCFALNKTYGGDVVGVDVRSYPEWEEAPRGVTLLQTDQTAEDPQDIGKFDLIYSNSVWEHVRHPFKMLKRAFDVLKPGGHLLLSANLHRGPKASHRYRDVFFPWPHLLFDDQIFEQFYKTLNLNRTSAWVNQLSITDYFNYFNMVGFDVLHTSYSITPIDEAFVQRFSDKLDRFPRYDLERDFIHVKLRKPSNWSSGLHKFKRP